MNRTDREDAVARALDLLPPGDPAGGDPRMARDARLLEEARSTREAAADVWLAVSPLNAAPPEVLHSVLEKIGRHEPASAGRKSRWVPWLAAGGWAAAALVALLLWPRGETEAPDPAIADAAGPPAKSRDRMVVATPETERIDLRRRKELMALRDTVERLSHPPGRTMPRVMSLSAPGAARRTPEETRERIRAILVEALRRSLEIESGAPQDPAALVIERGWLPQGFSLAGEDMTLRHRNFPEASWQDLGLLKGDDDTYYDPVQQFLWTRDGEQGGFVGRKDAGVDLATFVYPDEVERGVQPVQRTQPEGFVVEDPVTKRAEIVIDQVPAPAEGTEQVLVWTDVAGMTGSASLGELMGNMGTAGTSGGTEVVLNPPFIANSSAGGGVSFPMISLSVSNSGGLSSFQLVERSLVPDGTPDRVIVSGGE